MENYGLNFGMAFQIVDDCLDIVGNEEDMGKSSGTDLENGKLTLPYIFLLNNSRTSVRKEAAGLLQDGDGAQKFRRLKELATEEKAISYSLERARRYAIRAKKVLDRLNGFPFRRNLSDLVDFAIERNC